MSLGIFRVNMQVALAFLAVVVVHASDEPGSIVVGLEAPEAATDANTPPQELMEEMRRMRKQIEKEFEIKLADQAQKHAHEMTKLHTVVDEYKAKEEQVQGCMKMKWLAQSNTQSEVEKKLESQVKVLSEEVQAEKRKVPARMDRKVPVHHSVCII